MMCYKRQYTHEEAVATARRYMAEGRVRHTDGKPVEHWGVYTCGSRWGKPDPDTHWHVTSKAKQYWMRVLPEPIDPPVSDNLVVL